jgi:hypothetical protein
MVLNALNTQELEIFPLQDGTNTVHGGVVGHPPVGSYSPVWGGHRGLDRPSQVVGRIGEEVLDMSRPSGPASHGSGVMESLTRSWSYFVGRRGPLGPEQAPALSKPPSAGHSQNPQFSHFRLLVGGPKPSGQLIPGMQSPLGSTNRTGLLRT